MGDAQGCASVAGGKEAGGDNRTINLLIAELSKLVGGNCWSG